MSGREQQINDLRLKGNRLLMRAEHLLEQERDEVARPKLRAMLGKCFKYLNSYGSGDPKWFYYVRIVSFNEKDMSFRVVTFQHTSRKRLEIEWEQTYNYRADTRYNADNGWELVSAAEYDRERRKLLNFAKTLLTKRPTLAK